MTDIAAKHVDKAVRLIEYEFRTPWDWADLALEVAGAIGENGVKNDSNGKLIDLALLHARV